MMRRTSAAHGAQAIEFALVMPAFLLFCFAILEVGWLFYSKVGVQESVRTGCESGAAIPAIEDPLPIQTAEERIRARLDSYGVDCDERGHTCTIQVSRALSSPNEVLICRAWAPYSSITGLVPAPEYIDAHSYVLLELQR
jgi:hypothetical protein